MTDPSKIKPSHMQRAAYVYIRQSTPGQVEHNRESTARQYALVDNAHQLGWLKLLGLKGTMSEAELHIMQAAAQFAARCFVADAAVESSKIADR